MILIRDYKLLMRLYSLFLPIQFFVISNYCIGCLAIRGNKQIVTE